MNEGTSVHSTSGGSWGRMEANSSCLILRTFACVGYKESEEHIFKTKTDGKPFPLQNHRSLKDILASCRPESSKRLAASFFVQC